MFLNLLALHFAQTFGGFFDRHSLGLSLTDSTCLMTSVLISSPTYEDLADLIRVIYFTVLP